jgi:hypothetical protein
MLGHSSDQIYFEYYALKVPGGNLQTTYQGIKQRDPQIIQIVGLNQREDAPKHISDAAV